MSHIGVVVLLGSLRAGSLNRQIAETLQASAPVGVTVEIAQGLDGIPFYNEDLDTDVPPADAEALRSLVASADRVLAVTPEYNGTMPAVLNNAIDWLSRPYGQGALIGKPFAVVGANGGKWSHEDARRSARVAGAEVLDHIQVSQLALEGDILADSEIVGRLLGALTDLARHSKHEESVTPDPNVAVASTELLHPIIKE